MQLKNIQPVIALCVIALGLSFIASQIQAATFVSNTNPPTNDTQTPIYTTTDQIKGDSLPCTGTGTTCGISVNSFIAEQNASFNKQTFFSDTILGLNTGGTDSTLKFGGVDPTNIERTVDVNVTSSFKASGILAANNIGNSGGSGELCANINGDIILCP
jgi:hypothetical protein